MPKRYGFTPREVRLPGVGRFELDADGKVYELIGSMRRRVKVRATLAAVLGEIQRQEQQREYDDYVRQKAAGTWPKDRPAPQPPPQMHAVRPQLRRPTMHSILGAHIATKRRTNDGGSES